MARGRIRTTRTPWTTSTVAPLHPLKRKISTSVRAIARRGTCRRVAFTAHWSTRNARLAGFEAAALVEVVADQAGLSRRNLDDPVLVLRVRPDCGPGG